MADGANPVYEKEVHSEIFSQGTLMLRLVIQVSMFLAIPIMAVCLFIAPAYAAWYIAYVLTFNLLVGPVFSAGSVTGERERQTLDLLLTTTISPWQVLWGKLLAGLRVSTVLTLFLVWPLFLACVIFMVMGPFSEDNFYWNNLWSVLAYLSVILMTCATTASLALFCSVVFRKTSMSLMTTYILLMLAFCAPLAMDYFAKTFYPRSRAVEWTQTMGVTSPFAAAFSIPLKVDQFDMGQLTRKSQRGTAPPATWDLWVAYLMVAVVINLLLLSAMIWLFNARWRVSQ